MRKVRYHRAAREEVYDAAGYIDDRRPDYGTLFDQEVRSACRELAADPERWPVKLRGFRKYLTERFKYLIWYKETEEEIYVIAVHHSSRKPGYWKDRLLDEQR